VVQENLEVACSIIKNAAQEKAVKDIDVNLAPAYASRRKQREVS
jgi:CCR4-NOT transcription complex subunit 1